MTSGGRTARSQAVHGRLVAAAAELIAEVGWGNVSTRRIAERAGVNPGLVHYHVASVEELRRTAAVEGVRSFFEGPITEGLAGDDPRAGLASLFAALTPSDPRDRHLMLLYESLVAASRDEQLRLEIAASVRRLRVVLRDWLAGCGVSDPMDVAVTVTAAIDGYLLQRALDPSLRPGPLLAGLSRLLGSPEA